MRTNSKTLHYHTGSLCYGTKKLRGLQRRYLGPTYVYSLKRIEERARLLQAALPSMQLHYAVKANSFSPVLRRMKALGWGADVVSGGELNRALSCGFDSQDIIFSGVGKSEDELRLAISRDIYSINVESADELRRLLTMRARRRREHKPVSIMLRLNLSIDAKTHPYISTSRSSDKFGLGEEETREAVRILASRAGRRRFHLRGLAFHLGSQMLEVSPWVKALKAIDKQIRQLESHGLKISEIDVGGGMGVAYDKQKNFPLSSYGKALKAFAKTHPQITLHAEPGRFVVADSGFLVCRIEYIKNQNGRKAVILDSGMNHLIRPALYNAYHEIWPLVKRQGARCAYDFVGPLCESGDFFALNRKTSPLKPQDLIVIGDAGAYGAVMASQYNLKDPPHETTLESAL